MFAESDLPCKIVLVFVESDAFLGNYHKNPFEFGRKWTVEVSSGIEIEEENKSKEFLDERFFRLEKKLEEFMTKFHVESETHPKSLENVEKGKGKGKGKKRQEKSQEKSQESTNETVEEFIEREANRRLSELLDKTLETCQERDQDAASTSSFQVLSRISRASRNNSVFTEDEMPRVKNATKSKTVYIKNIQLLLNSTPIDQIDESQTRNIIFDI